MVITVEVSLQSAQLKFGRIFVQLQFVFILSISKLKRWRKKKKPNPESAFISLFKSNDWIYILIMDFIWITRIQANTLPRYIYMQPRYSNDAFFEVAFHQNDSIALYRNTLLVHVYRHLSIYCYFYSFLKLIYYFFFTCLNFSNKWFNG